jgi:hypothetical protein
MKYQAPLFVTLLVLIAGLTGQHATAATQTMNPVADAFVTTGPTGNLSDNNYGGAGSLAVSASSRPQGQFQTVMRFDLSAAKAAFDAQYGAGVWSIQSITLQLTANNPASNPLFNAQSAGQFQVFWMQNDSWTEGTGTPNAPTMDGISFNSLQNSTIGPNDEAIGTFSVGTAISGSTVFTLNLTSGFNADLLSGGLVSLRLASADNSVSYLFNSRTFNTASARPILTVNAVPEPGTFVLALGGFAVLAGWKLRRR